MSIIPKMNIEVLKNEPFVKFNLLPENENDDDFEMEFLIDTGFTGSILLTVEKNWNLLKVFWCSDIELLPESSWVILANGIKIQTFSAEIQMIIKGVSHLIPVKIIESQTPEPSLIGMSFLEEMDAELVLNFKKDQYTLSLK